MTNWQWLKQILLAEPALEDRGARQMVIGVLSVALAVDVFMIIVEVNWLVMIGFGALLLVALLLAWRGHLTPGRLLVPLAGLVMFAYLMFQNYGLRDTAVLGLPMVLLSASLMIGRRGAALYGLLGIAVVLLLGAAESRGLVRNPMSGLNTPADYLTTSVSIGLITALQWLVIGRLNDNINSARRSEAAQRQANEALRVSEARQRALLNAIPELVFRIRRDGVFLDYHVSQVERLAAPPEAFLGKPVQAVMPPSVAEQTVQLIGEVLATGQPAQFEYALSLGSEVHYFDARMVIGGADEVLTTVRDITERKRAEERLHASEERYRLISNVISDYTFSTAVLPDGQLHLEWVAGAFESITGYTFVEYVARGGWLAALHPADAAQDAADMAQLQTNRPVISEVRTTTKSGRLRWVRVYAHPVWDQAANCLVGIYGAVQDIDERKRVEAERENLIRELESRNAELERFTYTVSHDLKGPLITIRGFLGFLTKDALAGNTERLAADIKRIGDAADKMQRLLNELLELSRVGRLMNPPVEVAFEAVVRDALELLQGQLAARAVQVDIVTPLPVVYGDRVRLVEVMQNLIDNAVKFARNQPKPRIEIGARAAEPDGQPVFFVRDNGLGIDPQYHERVFGLFNKLDAQSEGTGVGLALVKRIVEVHGGRIWVESAGEGCGSTFCFTLAERAAHTDRVE